MDIAEKRIPQDGRVETTIAGRQVDMRLSILPTVNGEKVVIRLLGRTDVALNKMALGLSEHNEKQFDRIVSSPNGIILVSGPTGSGKTTTLYTVLKDLNQRPTSSRSKIRSNRLTGVNQVQVNTRAGMTFASGLRSILRQDPDIILIGEIRDGETAEIAIRASITGHLVLSTIHTNDAASTVTRLSYMGIEPYLVSSSGSASSPHAWCARSARRCKESYKRVTPRRCSQDAEPKPLFKGAGCPNAGHPDTRRTAIHEIPGGTRRSRADRPPGDHRPDPHRRHPPGRQP